MSISTVAPLVIAYLLGCATPVFIASQITREKSGDEGCLFTAILIGIFLAVAAVVYLWVFEPVI